MIIFRGKKGSKKEVYVSCARHWEKSFVSAWLLSSVFHPNSQPFVNLFGFFFGNQHHPEEVHLFNFFLLHLDQSCQKQTDFFVCLLKGFHYEKPLSDWVKSLTNSKGWNELPRPFYFKFEKGSFRWQRKKIPLAFFHFSDRATSLGQISEIESNHSSQRVAWMEFKAVLLLKKGHGHVLLISLAPGGIYLLTLYLKPAKHVASQLLRT